MLQNLQLNTDVTRQLHDQAKHIRIIDASTALQTCAHARATQAQGIDTETYTHAHVHTCQKNNLSLSHMHIHTPCIQMHTHTLIPRHHTDPKHRHRQTGTGIDTNTDTNIRKFQKLPLNLLIWQILYSIFIHHKHTHLLDIAVKPAHIVIEHTHSRTLAHRTHICPTASNILALLAGHPFGGSPNRSPPLEGLRLRSRVERLP